MKNTTVLIVEDERIVAEDIKISLLEMGYRIQAIVNSGEGAIESIREKKPDLVLLDIKLDGDMSGIETGRIINERFQIPFIYITANSNFPVVEKARATNPYGFIQKPFDEKDLEINIDLAIYRFRGEKERRERYFLYQSLFYNSSHPMVLANEKDQILDANDAYCRLMGYKKEELLKLKVDDMRAHPLRQPEQNVIREEIEKHGSREFNSLNITAAGMVINVVVQISPIEYDGETLYFVLVRDVTEEIKTRKELAESESRYQAIFNTAPVCLWEEDFQEVWKEIEILKKNNVTDFRSWFKSHPEFIEESLDRIVVLNINQQAVDFVDADNREQFLGPLRKSFAASDRTGLAEELTALAEGKSEFKREGIWITKNGEKKHVLFRVIFPSDRKLLNRVTISVTDITALKNIEEQLNRSLEEKTILLKELNHRTKNNMQVISGLLHIQTQYSDHPAVHSIFMDLRNRIESMAIVHKQLYQSENLARVNFNAYMMDLIKNLEIAFSGDIEKIRFILDLEETELTLEHAVPCGLILNEILTNSVKHAFKGKEHGEIRIELHKTETGEIVIIIRDNGKGMPEDFNITDSETLGMKLVSIIAEQQLHGSIQFTNDNGAKWELRFKQFTGEPQSFPGVQ